MKSAIVILHYKNYEHFWKCFNAIKETTNSDIYVVENNSQNNLTEMPDLVRKGIVKKYLLFEENITNGAIRSIFINGHVPFGKYEYITCTDSDLVPDDGWFEEEINVLKKYPEVYQMGISLYMDNLPIKTFPHSDSWIPKSLIDRGDFIETSIGNWLTTFRSLELRKYIGYLMYTETNFRDSYLQGFIQSIGRKSGRTKQCKAYHLTWDYYQDINHPYTQERINSPVDIWAQNKMCNYEVFYENSHYNSDLSTI